MVFPQEIYDLIVDEVAAQDYRFRDLRACAKASRVLLYPAYRHLFSHIRLTIMRGNVIDTKVPEFVSLLRSSLRSPDISIAFYIRTAEFYVTPKITYTVHVLTELWKVLYSFTRLEHLKVSSRDFLISFETHRCFLSQDFIDLCHSPTLSKLTLSNFVDAPAHLLRNSHISHIELSNVTFAPYLSERTFIHQPESIDVDVESFHSIINALHGGGLMDRSSRWREAFGRLRTLDIRPYGVVDLPDCLNVAAAASATLEILSIHIKAEFEIGPSSGDLKYIFHPFSNLRVLRIFFSHLSFWHPAESCFIDQLTSLLSLSTLPRSLQSLDIGANTSITLDSNYGIECDCRPSKRTDYWRRLDSVLADPRIAGVPSLRLFLVFFVFTRTDQRELASRTRKGIKEVLPVFCQTRLLSLTGQRSVVCNSFHI